MRDALGLQFWAGIGLAAVASVACLIARRRWKVLLWTLLVPGVLVWLAAWRAEAGAGGWFPGLRYAVVGLAGAVAVSFLVAVAAAVVELRELGTGGRRSRVLLFGLLLSFVASVLVCHSPEWRWPDPLAEAIAEDDLEEVRRRIGWREDTEVEIGTPPELPLRLAARLRKPRIVAYLLETGADPAFASPDQHVASAVLGTQSTGSIHPDVERILVLLIEHGEGLSHENLDRLHALAPDGGAPMAALRRRILTAERIQHGEADVAHLVSWAVRRRRNELVFAFLAAGGSVELRDLRAPLLLIAFEAGNDAVARELLRRGADVRATLPGDDGAGGDARRYLGRLERETVELFLAKAGPLELDIEGSSVDPVHEAVHGKRFGTAALLLQRGLRGEPALPRAIEARDREGARWLVAHGVQVNERVGSTTPLALACGWDPDLALELLARGARVDPELRGVELVEAVRRKRLDLVRALVEHGANVRDCPAYDSPLEAARQAKADDVAQFLLAHGATGRECE